MYVRYDILTVRYVTLMGMSEITGAGNANTVTAYAKMCLFCRRPACLMGKGNKDELTFQNI